MCQIQVFVNSCHFSYTINPDKLNQLTSNVGTVYSVLLYGAPMRTRRKNKFDAIFSGERHITLRNNLLTLREGLINSFPQNNMMSKSNLLFLCAQLNISLEWLIFLRECFISSFQRDFKSFPRHTKSFPLNNKLFPWDIIIIISNGTCM